MALTLSELRGTTPYTGMQVTGLGYQPPLDPTQTKTVTPPADPFDNATSRTMQPAPSAPQPNAPAGVDPSSGLPYSSTTNPGTAANQPRKTGTAALPDGGGRVGAASQGVRDPDGTYQAVRDYYGNVTLQGGAVVDPYTGQLTWDHSQVDMGPGSAIGFGIMGQPTTGPWSAFRYEPDPNKYIDRNLAPGTASQWMSNDRMMANIERAAIGARQLNTTQRDAGMQALWGNAYARGFQSPEEAAAYARAQQGDGSSRATFNAAVLGNLGARTAGRDAQEAFRAGQLGLMRNLQLAANGVGPSAAQQMLQTNRDEAVSQAYALAASQRGVSPAAALRAAQSSAETATMRAGRDMAALRAQEQLAARDALGGLVAQGRQGDLSTYGADIENMRARTAASLGAASAATQSFGAETSALDAAAGRKLTRDNMVMDWLSKGTQLGLQGEQNQTAFDAAKWQAKLGFGGLGADVTQQIMQSQQLYDQNNRQAIIDLLALGSGQYNAQADRDLQKQLADNERFDRYLGGAASTVGSIFGFGFGA